MTHSLSLSFWQRPDSNRTECRANMITSTIKQCPNSAIVMSGYSQGGQLVHNAAKLLPAATMAKVSSVVIFGDPGKFPLPLPLPLSFPIHFPLPSYTLKPTS